MSVPLPESERIASIDVLRGVALLGILVMNVVAFGLPGVAYDNPHAAGGSEGAHFWAWLGSHLFFELKMMAIFSMLFGAGIVLISERGEARGGSPRGMYFRRQLALLVIGLIHGYLLWYGDILFMYALCGLLLYWMRRWPPRRLIIAGTCAIAVVIPVMTAGGAFFGWLRKVAETRSEARKDWEEFRTLFDPNPEEIRKDIEVHQGGYVAIVRRRAPELLAFHAIAVPAFLLWRVGGMMLLGMGLMKLGVFSAGRSARFYLLLMLIGYGLGFPLVGFGAHELVAHRFDFIESMKRDGHFNYVGSLLVAFGNVGLVMLAVKKGVLSAAQRVLASVGRMALTNYLMQSTICTTIFYGYGFGLYGRVGRASLLLVVLGVWIVQLVVSPLWLRRFRFGPAEWLWRSVTYWKLQPMRAA